MSVCEDDDTVDSCHGCHPERGPLPDRLLQPCRPSSTPHPSHRALRGHCGPDFTVSINLWFVSVFPEATGACTAWISQVSTSVSDQSTHLQKTCE